MTSMRTGTRHLLPVKIGQRWLALDADLVSEILGARRWVPMPGATVDVPGVIAWRGRAVAVIDLGAMTEAAPPLGVGETRPRVIVLDVRGEPVAIYVDAVREARTVEADAVRPLHATSVRHAAGEIDLHGVLSPLVDLEAAVAALEATA